MKAVRFALATFIAGALFAAAPSALASNGKGGGVQRSGKCSAASTWKLSLKPDNGQIEVQFEVDQNVVGDTWNVRMTDNGTQIFKGTRVTQAPSGSFEVRKLTANLAGADRIVAKATNATTGRDLPRSRVDLIPRQSDQRLHTTPEARARDIPSPGLFFMTMAGQVGGAEFSSILFRTLTVSRCRECRTLLWVPSLLPPGDSPHAQSMLPVAKTRAPDLAL